MLFLLLRCWWMALLVLQLLPLTRLKVFAVDPQISNSSAVVDGELLSVTSWHARTLTNVSWDIPSSRQSATHLIVVTWDEEETTSSWWESADDNVSRANSPPSFTSSYSPIISGDATTDDACTFGEDAFDSHSQDAFNTDANRDLVSVDLADGTTWWYTASLAQERPQATTLTSGIGQASVLLSEPGFYTACLVVVAGGDGDDGDDGDDETCSTEECVDVTVYQPPYNFLEVESTNIGNAVTVRFNLASRGAYSGDWGWVLGGVDSSITLEDANNLSPDEANDAYDERCWFYFGRAVELGQTFLCSSEPDTQLSSFQATPTLRAYTYGRFELHLSAAGNGSLWFGIHEQYTYAMVTNFYTCGVTVQPLNSTTVTTTSDVVVVALPEQGELCDVGDGIELQVRSGEILASIEYVEAWIYFTGHILGISSEETRLSLRLAYKGEHAIVVYLPNSVTLATLNVTVIAAEPYAPTCEVAARPPSASPQGSSLVVSLTARDFYRNSITEQWGDSAFQAWTYASSNVGDNVTTAAVHDIGNGSYSVVSDTLGGSGITFLFVERNALGIPGSPFEVYVFGPATCAVVSSVGDCQRDLTRRVSQRWADNSPCLGTFDEPEHDSIACGYISVTSHLGTAIVISAAFAGLYAAVFLWWIRRNRKAVIVKLSQSFVCQLFLAGCILLNMTATLLVGVASDLTCVVQPWMLHAGLTFTSSCLYMKTYRVHRIFNNESKLARISITDRQLVSWVVKLVAVDVAFLLLWTILDRPRRVDVVDTVSGFEVINSKCRGKSDIPIYRVILWSWKACLNCFGVVMAAKTWHCEDGVGESQPICLSVYNTTLLGLVNLAVQAFLVGDGSTVIGVGTSAFTLIGGTLFAVSVLFVPKAYQLWKYGDLPANPAERRGSSTMTAYTQSYGRRGSTTANTGSGSGGGGGSGTAVGHRKSSTTLNLGFMGVGKIAPINEDKNAQGEKEEEEEGGGGTVREKEIGKRSIKKPRSAIPAAGVMQSRG